MKKILVILSFLVSMFSSVYAVTFDDAKRGCDNDIGAACSTLGATYAFGLMGVEPDQQKAEQYWKKGCDLNDGSACTTYAATLTDIDEQIKFFEKACSLGNENGCLGVKQQKTFMTNNQKCEDGDGDACYSMANHSVSNSDLEGAIKFFQTGCKAGHTLSCDEVKKLSNGGDKTELNAIKELKTKCDNGDSNSCLLVGMLYIGMIENTEDDMESFSLLMRAPIYFNAGCKLGNKVCCSHAQRIQDAMEQQEEEDEEANDE